MALTNPILTGMVRSAVVEDDALIFNRVFAVTVPTGIERVAGASKFKGTGRRISKWNNASLGEQTLVRAPLTPSVRGTATVEDYEIAVDEYSYEYAFEDDSIFRGGAVNTATNDELENEVTTQSLANMIKMDLELRAVALLKNTSEFTQGLDGSAGATAYWSDPSINPLKQLDTAYRACRLNGRFRPNGMVFSLDYWTAFKHNPYVQNTLGDAVLNLSPEELSIRITRVITTNPSAPPVSIFVADEPYNSANAGQSASPAFLYGSHAAMFYRPDVEAGDTVSLNEQSAGKVYEAFAPTVESYTDDTVAGRIHRCRGAATPQVFDATQLYAFRNMVP